jgi:large subunit ribosomal protein L31
MKEAIHPDYPPATVSCACGNSFVTRSTRGDFQVDVCSNCHPFYTGTQKLIDAAGRVDRFRKRYDKTVKANEASAKAAEARKGAAKAAKGDEAPDAEEAPKAEEAAAAEETPTAE